jgi:hypothetical protein
MISTIAEEPFLTLSDTNADIKCGSEYFIPSAPGRRLFAAEVVIETFDSFQTNNGHDYYDFFTYGRQSDAVVACILLISLCFYNFICRFSSESLPVK